MPSSRSRLLAAAAVLAILAACGGSSDGGDTPTTITTVGPDGGSITTQGEDVDAATDGAVTKDASSAGDADADAEDPPPATPAIRFVGRFDTTDPTGPVVGWPGARIIARFDGTQVSVTLEDTTGGKGNGYWDVIVDDVSQVMPLALTPGQATYALASGLVPGPHTVELYKRTEGQVSRTKFLGFDFGGGTLLAPPPAPGRGIEFIVDSSAIGYGIEGNGPSCSFTSTTENEHISYVGLAAETLGADHHTIGYSGKGVLQNYNRADTEVFELLFPRTLPQSTNPQWNFTQFVPDVVWLSLGGNDWDIPTPNAPPPALSDFQNAYQALVVQVRAAHPNAHIFLGVATSLNDDYPHGYHAYTNVKTALNNVIAQLADPKIYLHDFARANSTNLTGCDYHPNPAWSQSMATEVVDAIKDKTHWM